MTPDRRKGAVLLVGGLVVALLPSVWAAFGLLDVPASLGVVYLAASLAGGQRCALWSATGILLAFGAAAELYFRGQLPRGLDEATAEVLGIGVGLLLLELLRRAGYAVDLLGAATSVLVVAAVFALQRSQGGPWADPLWYGLAVAAYGLLELRPSGGRQRA